MSKHQIGEKDGAEPHSQKRAKLDLPTKDEQKQLQHTDLLMKTNLFQMEVEQLLIEVSGESKLQKTKVTQWTDRVTELLRNTKSYSDLATLTEKNLKKAGLKHHKAIELVNTGDEKLKIDFQAPSSVEQVGSSVYGTALSSMLNVDLAVTMPTELFDHRDILNHVYFDKRKLYLLGLYNTLIKHNSEETPLFSKISIAAFKGDLRKPILVMEAPFTLKGCSNGFSVRLIPCVSDTTFKAVQLRANKNNVRPQGKKGEDESSLPATPHYNLSILEDMALATQHRILIKTVGASAELKKALLLFKTWQSQRGFRFAADGFDGHDAALLLAYLHLTHRLPGGASVSAIAAFQTMLTFISEGNLQCDLDFRSSALGARKVQPNYHGSTGGLGTAAAVAKALVSNGGAAILDDSSITIATLEHSSILHSSTIWDYKRPLVLTHPLANTTNTTAADNTKIEIRYNALWRVSASSVSMLTSEAQRSLFLLQTQAPTCFENLFMQRRSFFERHDHFYHFKVHAHTLPYLSNCNIHVPKEDAQKDVFMRAVNEAPADQRQELRNMLQHTAAPLHFASSAVQLLSRALGDRSSAVHSYVRCVSASASHEATKEEELVEIASVGFTAHTPVWTLSNNGVNATATSTDMDYIVSIGVVLDREKMDRRVDRGPTNTSSLPDIAADPALLSNNNVAHDAIHEELVRFRALWGDKVQLRRFKDGAIVESVVWENNNKDNNHSSGTNTVIVEQVVKYILGRHISALCGSAGELVRVVNNQLERFTQHMMYPNSSGGVGVDNDLQSRKAVEALDQLRNLLTSQLKKLPLSYESLMAVAPELRYTSLFAPAVHPLAQVASSKSSAGGVAKALKQMLKHHAGQTLSLLATPLKVLVQLESSGKWPLEAEAIKKSKLALLLKTKAELKAQFEISSVIHEDATLDVCYEGYVFRLQLVATPEIEAAQLGHAYSIDSTSRTVACATVVAPLHHLGVRALRSQYPSYTGAVRLMTAWAAQHYYSGHLCLEHIELIVAYEYLHPYTAQPPASPLAGFYRALLRLAQHNWDATPLIVDLSGEGKELQNNPALQAEIVNKFNALRNNSAESTLDPQSRRLLNTALYIVSSADRANHYYPSVTAKSPERVVLSMIVRSAEASAVRLLSYMQKYDPKEKEELSAEDESAALQEIMHDSTLLSKCHLLLKCNKALCNNKNVAEGPAFARLSVFANTPASEANIGALVVRESTCSLHPIQEGLVRQLNEKFGDLAVFFWNSLSGREIGVLWRPTATAPASFGVLSCQHRLVVVGEKEGAVSTVLNKPSVIAQMLDLGEGLIVGAEELV